MDFAARLKSTRVQSATTVTIESLRHLAKFYEKNGFGKKFEEESRRLIRARPTAVVLQNALEKINKERSAESIGNIISSLEGAKAKAARNFSRILKKKSVVMTHCHSTFVVAALAGNRRSVGEVIVTETRPRYQGIRTEKDLAKERIPVTLIIEEAAGGLMGRTDMVLVGADALRAEGLVNKIGTHPLALEASDSGKPFYVITSSFAFDRRKRFFIEQRPTIDLGHEKSDGARIQNPAFDVTPWKYVTAIITDRGIIRQGKIRKMLRR